jgi:RsiW-degrading membrane proteinase PrsW (M82 family)
VNLFLLTFLQVDYDANPAEAFSFEITREDLPTTVGSTAVYSQDGSIVGEEEGKKHSGGVLAVLFFSGMIASVLVAGVIFWFITKKRPSTNPVDPSSTDYRLLHPNV